MTVTITLTLNEAEACLVFPALMHHASMMHHCPDEILTRLATMVGEDRMEDHEAPLYSSAADIRQTLRGVIERMTAEMRKVKNQ
jgi:hypothetical protein